MTNWQECGITELNTIRREKYKGRLNEEKDSNCWQKWQFYEKIKEIINFECSLSVLDTHLATGHSRPGTAGFHCLALWNRKLLVVIDCREPERELVGEEVARPSGTVAFDEWRCSEVLQTRSR